MKKTILSLLTSILICGCTVGPNYNKPETPTPKKWAEPLPDTISTQPSQGVQWWQSFSDPILTELICRAENNNKDLLAAASRIKQSRYQLAIAKGLYYPNIDAVGSFSRSKVSDNTAYASGPTNLYSAGLDMSWEIDLFGKIKRSTQQAQANIEMTTENYHGLMVSMYADVATNYVELRAIEKRIKYALENIEIQKETLSLTQSRFDANLVSQLDVAQAKLNLYNTESTIPPLMMQKSQIQNRLATLLGLMPGEIDKIIQSDGEIPQTPAKISVGAPADLVRQRPDIRSAERKLVAQTAAIGVAKADLYPSLSITGNFSFQAGNIGNLDEWSSKSYSFGPAIGWNIFDGKRIKSNIALEKERLNEYLTSYQQSVLLALEEVEGAISAYVQEKLRNDSLSKSVEAARMSVELANNQYRSGLTDFQNVLDMQRTLSEQQDRLAQSEGLVVENIITIYKALGGGWSE